jgi:UDP-N-acetylmuramoyl-tripeptide--D-alanyl-D-alanine ligase
MSIAVDDLLGVGQSKAVNFARLHRKTFPGISTDTRTIRPGFLFFALRGERHDGHAFVREAFAKGAACAVIDDRADRSAYEAMPAMVVKDTVVALGDLARLHRRRFRIPVIAIGGSNGKTTTKELVSAVLKLKYRVHATEANYNNQIGVPMTLLGLKKKHGVAVIEVGTNHFGELRYLGSIVEPTHVLLTNIGNEHLEFFGSIDGAAKEEGELFASLGAQGTAIVNIDDQRIVAQAAVVRKKIRYGFSAGAAIRGTLRSYRDDGRAECTVKAPGKKPFPLEPSLPGEHNAANALAAAAIGLSFGVPVRGIQTAVKKFRAADKRMAVVKAGGVTIVNDTYNANGDSVIGALAALKSMSCRGKKVVLLGEMLELGGAAEAEHRRVGAAVAAMEFEYLLTVGPLARFVNEAAGKRAVNFHYDQKNQLAEYALELLAAGDIVLVKGSRGSRMEDVVTFLHERIVRKTA